MKPIIENSKNETIDIYSFRYLIDIDDIDLSKKAYQNYFSNKTYIIGSGLIEPKRNIKIILHIAKKTEQDFLNLLNSIYNFFYKENAPFYYKDLDNNRMCEIELISIKKMLKEGTEFIFSSIELNLQMVDLVFFDISETMFQYNFLNSNNIDFQINNIKSNIIYPRFEITFDQSISDLIIQGEKEFSRYLFSNYVYNDILIIDSFKNEIKIIKQTNIEIEASNNLYQGGYILLYKGNNNIKLNFDKVSNGYVKVYYRENYII